MWAIARSAILCDQCRVISTGPITYMPRSWNDIQFIGRPGVEPFSEAPMLDEMGGEVHLLATVLLTSRSPPADSLVKAISGKVRGIPCDVLKIKKLEPQWNILSLLSAMRNFYPGVWSLAKVPVCRLTARNAPCPAIKCLMNASIPPFRGAESVRRRQLNQPEQSEAVSGRDSSRLTTGRAKAREGALRTKWPV
jgi:hypothetical protein